MLSYSKVDRQNLVSDLDPCKNVVKKLLSLGSSEMNTMLSVSYSGRLRVQPLGAGI